MPRSVWLFLLGTAFVAWPVGAHASSEQPPPLKVVARYSLATDQPVMDVRWASKDSLFIAYQQRGVFEVQLREGLPERRQVFPPATALGFPVILSMAVSDGRIVATSIAKQPAWREVDATGLYAETAYGRSPGTFFDLDLRGDDLVILGHPDDNHAEEAPGGWLWRADVSDGLASWQLLAENKELTKQPNLMIDRLVAMGSVRFLRTGGFVAAPNFVPGVFLFSKTGKLKQTWTPEDLWHDKTETRWKREGFVGERELADFLGSERVIDEVLVLSNDPAIVVREVGQKGRWQLAVLGPEVRWFRLPANSFSSVAHVRGDADERGRVALLGAPRELYDEARLVENELLILELPD